MTPFPSKVLRTGLLCGLLILAAGSYIRAGDAWVGSPQLEKIKKLSGKWIGPNPMRRKENVAVEYSVIAAGTAVLEKIFAGTPNEMVSLYFDEGSVLRVNHYGMLPDFSRLDLRITKDNELTFLLPIGSGKRPDSLHLHELLLSFVDEEHLTQKWTTYDDRGPSRELTLTLARADGNAVVLSPKEARKAAKEAARRAAEEEKAVKAADAARERNLREQESAARKQERKLQASAKSIEEPEAEEPARETAKPAAQTNEDPEQPTEKKGNPVVKGVKKVFNVITGD